MANVASLKAIIDADTSGLEKGAARGKAALGSLSSGMGGAGVASGALSVAMGGLAANVVTGVVGAAVAGGKAAVKMAGDLQQAVANISSIKPEINTTQVFAALNEMQTRVPQTAKELGDSLYDVFSSVNVTQKEGLALVEKFGRGAVGAQTDAKTFGTATMGVMNAYKLAVKDADHISDLFFNTIKTGVVTGPQLAAGLGPVTSAAKSAGQSIESMFAALAASTKEGGEASQNLNNINNLFQKLTTEKAKQGFTGLGIAVSDSGGKFRQINEIVGDFIKKTEGLSAVAKADLMNKIFPDAQARQGFAVLVSQFDTLNSALKENKTKAGAARAAYETMSNTFNAQSALLKNSFNAILTEIGGRLLPMLTPLIRTFAAELPGAISATKAAFSDLAAATVPALEGLLSSLAGVPVKLEDVTKATQEAARDTATGFAAAWPAIQQGATAVLKPAIDFIVGLFRQVVVWVRENMPLIEATVRQVSSAINALWRDYGADLTAIVKAVWSVLASTIQSTLSLILNILKLAMQVFTGDWRGAWETVKTIFANGVAFVKGLWSNLGSALLAILNTIKTGIVRGFQWIFEQAVNLGRNIAQGMANGIRNAAGVVIDGVKSLANDAIGATRSVLGIRSPSRIFHEIGNNVAIGMINGLNEKKTSVSEAARILGRAAHSGAKSGLAQGKSELDKEVAAFAQALGSAKAKLASLKSGGSQEDTAVAGRFRLLSSARRGELAGIYESIKAIEKERQALEKRNQAAQRLASDLENTREQIQKQIALRTALDSRDKLSIEYFSKFFAQLSDPENKRLIQELASLRGAFIANGSRFNRDIVASPPSGAGVTPSAKPAADMAGVLKREIKNMQIIDTGELAQAAADAIKKAPWREVMIAAWSDLSALLSQAVSGKRSGGLLGGILGGIAGFAIGGPAGAFTGFQVGAAAGNAYQSGGLASGLVEGGLAYVAGRGGPSVVFGGGGGGLSAGGGGGRSVNIGTVIVNNPTDAARLERVIVGTGVIESRNPY